MESVLQWVLCETWPQEAHLLRAHSLAQAGRVGGLQGRQSWAQNPDPCAQARVFLLVGGDDPMLRDRPAPAALRLSQPSWASRTAGRLGMAGKQVQAVGSPPPRPGCGVGPRRVEVPTAQLLPSLPNAPGPGSVSAGEGGGDASCPGQGPV